MDVQPKPNVRMAFTWCSGRYMNALCTFNLGSVTTGISLFFNNFLFPFSIKNTTNNKTQELFIYKKK